MWLEHLLSRESVALTIDKSVGNTTDLEGSLSITFIQKLKNIKDLQKCRSEIDKLKTSN